MEAIKTWRDRCAPGDPDRTHPRVRAAADLAEYELRTQLEMACRRANKWQEECSRACEQLRQGQQIEATLYALGGCLVTGVAGAVMFILWRIYG